MAKIKKEFKTIAILMFLLGFGVLFLGAIALSGTGTTLLDFYKSLSVQFGFIVISVLAYSTTILAGNLLGLGKNKWFHIWTGTLFGLGYILISSFVPGLSIAIPLLSSSISSGLQKFVVCGVAPIVESIALLGVLLGILKTRFKPIYAIILTGIFSALFHLGAFIFGIYDYSATQGFLGFTANISVFISAFIFFTLSGYLVHLKKWKGLLVAMIIHFWINVWVYTKFAIIFATSFGLI